MAGFSMNGVGNMLQEPQQLKPSVQPFAGRLGGNQEYILDRDDPDNEKELKKVPDAAPFLSVREALSPHSFLDFSLWRMAMVEGIAAMMLVYMTGWMSMGPARSPGQFPPRNSPAGVFATVDFFGPLIGGITNWLILTTFTFTFGPVSGGHINPTISIATFFARLITLPRLILYVAAQMAGGTLAGLALRKSYGSRDFVAGGCWVDTSLVSVSDAFTLEFMSCLIAIFLSFGVALDPRQKSVYGASLSPWLAGMILGVLSFGSGFTRLGYMAINPARCFGIYVGSRFPPYHWIHWVGPITASMAHGLIYFLVPPWDRKQIQSFQSNS